ncbi:uncharacterized protein LOC117323056 isoform X1 [Pecten maximus]|uniref:uncharacterized protein LOC117323056 isoform X1 n=1 Tax=Pecten maximus TaxID=6579 RepID=UPI0014580ADB|nr:uncharacterized protein LOC117323056 isoform X1 [Pecten maximus]
MSGHQCLFCTVQDNNHEQRSCSRSCRPGPLWMCIRTGVQLPALHPRRSGHPGSPPPSHQPTGYARETPTPTPTIPRRNGRNGILPIIPSTHHHKAYSASPRRKGLLLNTPAPSRSQVRNQILGQ